MGYVKLMDRFRYCNLFTEPDLDVEGSDLKIRTLKFESNEVETFKMPSHPDVISVFSKEEGELEDKDEINRNFTVPIFLPLGERKYDKVIVLLHGLNERSWVKYLPWAADLSKRTKSAVVLFPISYHMNRAPKQWGDPRAMISLLNSQKASMTANTTFANIALSERLKSDPLRFFSSGYQSADDLVKLVTELGDGKVAYVKQGAQIDFFSYSIGAFLSQILFISNPNGIVSNSRLFMFGGGSFFDTMNGVSRLIMDEQAFYRIFDYYTSDFEKEAYKDTRLGAFVKDNILAMSFRSMIKSDRLVDFRNDMLKMYRNQFYAIALTRDTVISPVGISSFFRSIGSKNIEMVDFAYPHSHEQPFPINGKPILNAAVDAGFNHVFKRAASFLA